MMTRVVICGSYHRQPQKLARLFRELETSNCRILAPLTLNFIDTEEPIVHAESDESLGILDLESFHLRAIREADLILLHAPDGHVGLSGAYEVGYAEAIHKPVFCLEDILDEMLKTRVYRVQSVFEALELGGFA